MTGVAPHLKADGTINMRPPETGEEGSGRRCRGKGVFC